MCVTIQLWCLHRALLRAQQVENCATRRWDLCHQHMETSSPLPWYYLKYSFSCFKFRWSGGGRVLRWKWAEKLLDVTVRFLLLNVCLLLGCWQSFYSHSKLFMLISHMDTLKNSWAKRSENPDFSSMWGSVHLWVSVGQMIPITVPWWRLGVDSCSGDLYQLARRKGAFTEMLLQRALAGKPFLNVPLPGNVISQVLQNSSNRPLCRVYRPNVYPAEVRF